MQGWPFRSRECVHCLAANPPSKTTSHWGPLQGLPTDSDSESDQDTAEDDLSDPAWERPATPERPITPPPPPQLLTPPAQIQRNLVRASRLLATSTPPDQPIIPLISQLFAVHTALARQSLPVERSTPPPLPPPLPPHPPPPEGLPQRKAKLQAQSRLTSRPSHKIPQLEGAEPTPETTPDTSLLSPSKKGSSATWLTSCSRMWRTLRRLSWSDGTALHCLLPYVCSFLTWQCRAVLSDHASSSIAWRRTLVEVTFTLHPSLPPRTLRGPPAIRLP